MGKKRRQLPLLENLVIEDAGSQGKAVARTDNRVVFIPYGAPGDVVDVQVYKKKRAFFEARIVKTHKLSEKRQSPFCEHFGLCGGCKWQHLKYEHQLFYKQKQVVDNFTRLANFEIPELSEIIPSENTTYYRNKMEFSFSARRWLLDDEETDNTNGLGFHIPGRFDRIVDVKHCWLQAEPSNKIRLAVKEFTTQNNYPYYEAKSHNGFMRSLLVRSTDVGDLMVIIVFAYEDKEKINALLEFLKNKFPEITSLYSIINQKMNDSLDHLKADLYSGKSYIEEVIGKSKFQIGPFSFFQTNSKQAKKLYDIALEFAELKGNELIYDLYTGTGTIANYMAPKALKVVGIEYVDDAIKDAVINSQLNEVENTVFFSGDMVKVLDDTFVNENGIPDIIITDPPRAGMHKDVIAQIIKINPKKIVYISCNPATQARDIDLMKESYKVVKIQPIDMFPHTHHVENVVLLIKND